MNTPRKPVPASLLAAGALLATLGLAGCSNNPPQSPPTVVNTAPAPAAATTAPAGTDTTTTATGTAPAGPDTKINVNAGPGTSQGTDQATGEAVNKAIVTNKEMTGARVEAVVTGGVATLTGSVQNQQQKALAEKAAHDTSGVTSVKNKLQINPTGGAKSASKPPTTKVIVVHKTVTSAAPPQPPSPPAPPEAPSAGGSSSGTGDSMSTGAAASGSPSGGSDSSTSGTTAPASNGSGQ